MKTIAMRIAEELSVPENQVQAAIMLLDEGATVNCVLSKNACATCASWMNAVR